MDTPENIEYVNKRDKSPVRPSTELSVFVKYLTHVGYRVEIDPNADPVAPPLKQALNMDHVIVCMLDRETFEDAKTFRDIPIFVYGYDSDNQREAGFLMEALDCGGLYTFVRYFKFGEDKTRRSKNFEWKVPSNPDAKLQ